jgi:hypothetical protein
MKFEVIAYAGTEPGQNAVRSHVTQPAVHVVEGCPTIKNTFSDPLRAGIYYLCEQYNPKRYTAFPALGYGSVGSLMHRVFERTQKMNSATRRSPKSSCGCDRKDCPYHRS